MELDLLSFLDECDSDPDVDLPRDEVINTLIMLWSRFQPRFEPMVAGEFHPLNRLEARAWYRSGRYTKSQLARMAGCSVRQMERWVGPIPGVGGRVTKGSKREDDR